MVDQNLTRPFPFTTFFFRSAFWIRDADSSRTVAGVFFVTRFVGRHRGYADRADVRPHAGLSFLETFTHSSLNHLFSPADFPGCFPAYVPPLFLYSRTIHADLYALVGAENFASADRLTLA